MNLQNYEILNKLGEGAFGVVYKARDKNSNNICVVKKIDISKMSPKLRRNAMQQGKILKQLKSPYIVQHYTSFVEKSTLVIVMEYCPKGDLAAFIKGQMGKPLKQQKIWKFSIQMMIGLRDIHAKKILHRDMKALNIFLDSDGNVRIGDLGVAKQLKADFAYTIVGTPYYLSPQMCQEKPYNEKTDIWAMGCIIYQLCTGKHPFQANNQAALALKIVMGKYKNIPSNYSSDLQWLVKSCLSVDYKRRPTAISLLTKASIIQKAQKLGITINSGQKEIISPQKSTNQIQKNLEKKEQKQKLAEKKQPIKMVKQPPTPSRKQSQPIPIVLSKKQTSGSDSRRSAQKRVSVQKKQRVKQPPKYNLPPKKQKMPPLNIQLGKAKKYSGAKLQEIKQQKQRKSHSRNKSNIEITQNKSSLEKVQKIKQQSQYFSVKAPPQNNANLSATMNRFLPEDFRKKKQFDFEDQHADDKVLIPDSDSDSDENIQKNSDKKSKNGIFQNVQQLVDDDDLMEEFGISPAKKQTLLLSDLKLQNKVKEINWDIDAKNATNKSNIDERPLENQSTGLRSPNLPTIKTPSYLQKQPLIEMNMEQEEDLQDNLLEQEQQIVPEQDIQENQPYISDQEQQPTKQCQIPNSNQSKQVLLLNNRSKLIEDYPEQYKKMSKKLQQNKKRQNQLQKMKNHYEKQLLKLISSRDQYQKIKQQLINHGNDEAVEKVVSKWEGSLQSMNLFYRIIHFEMELKRCIKNIQTIENKLVQIKKNM